MWNIITSYGESNGCFLDESETPEATDSQYKRVLDNTSEEEGNHD